MIRRDYTDYLNDMVQATEDVAEFIQAMTFRQFLHDRKTMLAVIRCIEVIGEASKNLPVSLKAKTPDIDWNALAGMRNRIAHEYFGIDNQIVWKTAKHYLPRLRKQITKLLNAER